MFFKNIQTKQYWFFSHASLLFYVISFAIFASFLIAPIWVIHYLPLGDLPQHAAQIRMILDYFSGETQSYELNVFTPYLLGYIFTLVFTPFFSTVTSIKIALTLAVLAIPFSTAGLIKSIGGNKFWVWTAFPIAYSFSFYWGFFNYIFATPMAIAFIWFTVVYAKKNPDSQYYIAAALFASLLFFGHALIWAFCLMVASLIILSSNPIKVSIKKIAAFFASTIFLIFWVSKTSHVGFVIHEGEYLDYFYQKIVEQIQYTIYQFDSRTENNFHIARLKQLFSFSIGMPEKSDYIAIVIFLFVWPALAGAILSKSIKNWMPVFLVALFFMLVPYWWFNAAYIYQRFAVFLIPFSYFIYEKKNTATKSFFIYIIGFLVIIWWLVKVNIMFYSFNQSDKNFQQIVSFMQADKEVISLIFDGTSPFRISPAYLHFSFWYQAEKSGYVIPNFASNYSHTPIRYKGESHVWLIDNSWDPSKFDWDQHQGKRYDYFIVRSDKPRDYLFTKSGGTIKLLKQAGSWFLYGKESYFVRD